MKTRLVYWMIFLSISLCANASEFHLSDSCRISLLTCTPGNELYSCFGHSGIRVNDPLERVDIVFNYGTFNFERPGFYLNFCRGILIYSLGVDQYYDFENQYIYERRGLYEQVLHLTQAEKTEIVAFLLENAQPENRDYRYDFLLDNCATRIRDVFEKHLGKKLQFHTSTWDTTKTFRYLIDEYSWYKRWESFGMNLLIGLPVDKPTTPREQMFLPDYLKDGFAAATINNTSPFVSSYHEILPKPNFDKRADWSSPTYIFSILLLIVIVVTLYELYTKSHFRTLDFLFFFHTGLVGLLFVTLWLFTQHWTTAWNLNLLWALPTNIILAIGILKQSWVQKMKSLILFTLCMELFLLLFHSLLPQPFQLGMILLNMLLVVRLFRLFLLSK